MTPGYELTEDNVAGQIAEIQSRIDRLSAGLNPTQLNWQPDGGRKWSVGQCLDHVATSTLIYAAAIDHAVASAPPTAAPGARPNLMGRAFIWSLEPPVRIKTPAPGMIQPKSSCDPAVLQAEIQDALALLRGLTSRAVTIDAGRVRFKNPLARGLRVFNVATGIFVILAHARRHLLQAEHVKARPDFPSA